MRIDVLTLFPAMFESPLSESILKRAQEQGLLTITLHDLREYGLGNYKQVDDAPYGGGAGMVMRVDVVVAALEATGGARGGAQGVRRDAQICIARTGRPRPSTSLRTGGAPLQTNMGTFPHRICLSPKGRRLTQPKVEGLARHNRLLLLCGHYEGVDQRVIAGGFIDEEISIGDYVLTGGELPAMVLIDAVARLLPGVIPKEESTREESFSAALRRRREYPHYTRPEEFRGLRVPEVLLSGNHAEIAKWRSQNLR